MDKQPILQVKNLSVNLEGEQILRDISFSVKRGEALAIIGPNGAGKTMLFNALLGLAPYSGEVAWAKGARIGYAPQRFAIDKSIPITVNEFFLLQSKHFWAPSHSFSSHLKHELNLVGLPENILQKPFSDLSGGETQRLLIAWAMLEHPDVLLFDEPTSGIDIGFEETIYTIMHKMQEERGITILIISHDLNVVYRYAQNVLCLNKTVLCQGPPQKVLTISELAKIYGETGFYHHN